MGKLELNFQATLPLLTTPLLTCCDVTDVGGARFTGYCATLTVTKARCHETALLCQECVSTAVKSTLLIAMTISSAFWFCFVLFLQCWSVSEPESIPLWNCPAQHMQRVKSCARCRVVSSLKPHFWQLLFWLCLLT